MDIPEELVRAARSGSLVLFVGAGASRDAPASLPSFTGLTSQIADEAGVQRWRRSRPTSSSGASMTPAWTCTNACARTSICPALAPTHCTRRSSAWRWRRPFPRIVTTNYDSHLSRVVKARRLSWADFLAPALPMGDDFEGIVYLHGSLRQESRHLIVTDKDFGRAYLRDAWAARFLERMFSSFTVLFIGYSHDDVVMRYLAAASGASLAATCSHRTPMHRSGVRWVSSPSPTRSEQRRTSHCPGHFRLGRAPVDGPARPSAADRASCRCHALGADIPEEQSYLSSDHRGRAARPAVHRPRAGRSLASVGGRAAGMPIDLRPGCCLDDRLGRPRVLVRRAVPLGRSAVGRRAEHPGWGGWPNVTSTLERRRAATAHRWLAATGVAGAVGRLPRRVRTGPTGGIGSSTRSWSRACPTIATQHCSCSTT